MIVTIEGIPLKFTINRCVGIISKVIKEKFEGLNFTPSPRKGTKAFHINILDDTKAQECAQKLNGIKRQDVVFTAHVSNAQPYMNTKMKKFKQGKNRNRHLKMPQTVLVPKERMFNHTRNDLIYELQDKHTALMEINKAVGNKLLHEIVKVVEGRLRPFLNESENGFVLSSNYRFKYPHNTDFDLIKNCLAKTGSNLALTKEMLKCTPQPYEPKLADSMPLGTVQGAISKYSSAIHLELVKYVNSLEANVQGPGIDAAAQNKVREQFKKLAPSIPYIVVESLTKHIMSPCNVTLLRIYGEPSLPKLPTMQQFITKHRGTMFRSPHLYNCIHAQVPNAEVPALLAADSTWLEGRNLVIRIFCKDIYRKILKDVTSASTGKNVQDVTLEDEDAWENWDEEM
ncbi:uncharacterized protein LOC121738015 [Aricia agestis]|uniref:uncharacterized protein LOC121738015 n=1 Tax=Aricia agestis TaxID=91739 RepID=UPI001C20BA7D|nr:uncharacterized protein LOC121738015 [Aricia agestis]